jgi:thiol-disulfide isomerase/thioredoxin
MKKLNYFLAAGFMALIASCADKPGYVITGTVEGGQEGDTVFLQELAGREFNNLDTAVIRNGKFEFKGVQDSIIFAAIQCNANPEKPLAIRFFLENGKISVCLGENINSAIGSPTNDIYQPIREKLDSIGREYYKLSSKLRNDSTLTDAQKEEITVKINSLEQQDTEVSKSSMFANIENPVGVLLFKSNFYEMSIAENDSVLSLIPEQFQSDEAIVKIKETVAKQKLTAPGAKFIDVELATPEGTPVKLSDYVGKGKLVLLDFWASWCGPCRREMPNIVEIYKDYKGDKFEIVGISLDSNGDAWKGAIKELGITWPQMSDLKGWGSEGAQLYAVNSIPCVLLIDGEGTIVARGLHGEELRAKVDELMK